jgi:hypothetical protein
MLEREGQQLIRDEELRIFSDNCEGNVTLRTHTCTYASFKTRSG